MDIKKLKDLSCEVASIEYSRSKEDFLKYIVLKIQDKSIRLYDKNESCYDNTTRLMSFVLRGILKRGRDIVEEAFEEERLDFESKLKELKEVSLEYATGMKVQIDGNKKD